MDILLLAIYAFLVWLIFIKFKWLPWNITSQVIVTIIPIVALTILILTLNVVAPSSLVSTTSRTLPGSNRRLKIRPIPVIERSQTWASHWDL